MKGIPARAVRGEREPVDVSQDPGAAGPVRSGQGVRGVSNVQTLAQSTHDQEHAQ